LEKKEAASGKHAPLKFEGYPMSLYLGKTGRRIVERSLTSPKLGKAADAIGKVLLVLTSGHYKVGLTRIAFQLSQSIKPGDVLKIQAGQIIINDTTILTNEKLFKGINIDRIDVTEKMCSPEGTVSYLRWNVFYDKSKLIKFTTLFFSILAMNISLNSILTGVFERQSLITGQDVLEEYLYPIIDWSKFDFGILPSFHSSNDPADTFICGLPTKLIVGRPIFILSGFWLYSFILAEFHRDNLISHSAYKNWSKFSNIALALVLAGGLTQHLFCRLFHGVWDYIYFAYIHGDLLFQLSLNTSDILLHLCTPLISIGSLFKLFISPLEKRYTFLSNISTKGPEVNS